MNPKRLTLLRSILVRLLSFGALFYLSLIVVACSLSNKLLFLPPPPQYASDESQVVLLGAEGDQVACLYYPPAPGAKVVLWAHGNAEDIGSLRPLLVDLHHRGLGVLAYDYPGYGLSAGAPSEQSCYRAAARAYDFLVSDQEIDPARIVLLGQSVGSGPACWLAERNEAAALILITPFLSAYRTLTHIPLIPGDKFKNLPRIKKIGQPLLVIHGASDEIIPYRQGRRLYREHRGPKQFLEIPGAGHNDLWSRGHEDMMRAITEFVRGAGA